MCKRVLVIAFCMGMFLSSYTLSAKNRDKGEKAMELTVSSSAFTQDGAIPVQYTCDDKDLSPPLSWTAGPAGTKSYAIIVDDPDAPMGTWVHWVVYNIPAAAVSMPENVAKEQRLSDGTIQGINDFKRTGYGGPCPPGGTHRYFFKVYALDQVLTAGPGLTKKKLLREIEGHILAQGELMGTYSR
jgi:Raf kinase inhibitor-like YbhB/YbcL family protein